MEKRDYDLEREEKAKQIVEDFSNLVNSTAFEPTAFIQAFKKQHKTLQQKMFSTFLALVVEMTKETYNTDLRNEYSKEIAKKIIAGLGQQFAEDYLKENNGHGVEYYEKIAKQIQQDIIDKPANYLRLPHI